nr:uncharacterized protein LOC110892572 [Ipomoea batatas]
MKESIDSSRTSRNGLQREILVTQAKQGGATCEPKRGVVDEASKEKELLAKANNHIPSGKPSKGERKEKPVLPRYLPPIPFPQRLAKEEDLENQGEMPKFSLYLKELLNHKKKLEDVSRVVLNEECSAVLHKECPPKLVDAENGTRECMFRILDHIAPKAQALKSQGGTPLKSKSSTPTESSSNVPLVEVVKKLKNRKVQDLILANVPVVVQTGPVSQEHASAIDLARENITKAIGWIVREVNEKAA